MVTPRDLCFTPAGELAIPAGIKDVTATKGIRTAYGSKLFEQHVPDEDAVVAERLKSARAIILGKTNTPEFTFGPNTTSAVPRSTRWLLT
jgi:Asp-tRNA(Asn)/Glu-tRNA(Gln) amidotransferase A subunit family amidase